MADTTTLRISRETQRLAHKVRRRLELQLEATQPLTTPEVTLDAAVRHALERTLAAES